MTDRYASATAALAELAMPVVVVGAARGEERSCATGTVMYTSLAPVQVAIALHPGSRTCALLRATREFSVSILGADQVELAAVAGRSARGPDKFVAAGIPTLEPAAGFIAPGVAGSVAVVWCRLTLEIETGDHLLVIGEVHEHQALASIAGPLVRVSRRYVGLGGWLSDVADDKYPL